MPYSFQYADKKNIKDILPLLFGILHSNMSVIAPSGSSYEEDYKIWLSNIVPAMEKDARQIVLMFCGDELSGYFQYYVNAVSNSLMMEEIQIREKYQGAGLFSEFYRWLVSKLPKDIKFVEAYSHKNNRKSQIILEHLGLVKSDENKHDNLFYYKGDYSLILKKYMSKG